MDMDAQHLEYIGLGLFVVSEIIGMSKLRSNSVLQLLLMAARQAFPYKRREDNGVIGKILGK
jgi:hypothetical protein